MSRELTIEKLPSTAVETTDRNTDRYLDGIQVCASAVTRLYQVPNPETMLPAMFNGRYEQGVLTKFGQEVLIASEYEAVTELEGSFPSDVHTFVAQMRPREGVDVLELASSVQQLFGIGENSKFKYSGMRFYDGISLEGKDIVFALKGYNVRDVNDLDVVSGIIARLIEIRIENAELKDSFTPGLMKIAHAPVNELDVERFRDLVIETDLNEEAIRLAAGVDSMTQLPNRLGMYRLFQDMYDMLPDDTRKFVLTIFTDGDGFKHANDTYGHSEGDKIIHSLAKKVSGFGEAFKRAFPAYAQELQVEVGRYGGDEFVLSVAGIEMPGDDEMAIAIQEFIARYFKNESMPEYGVSALFTPIKDPDTGKSIQFDTTSTIGICAYSYADAKVIGYEEMVRQADVVMNEEKARTLRRRAGEQIGRAIGGEHDNFVTRERTTNGAI